MAGEYGRRMDIRVEIDRWSWPSASKVETLNVTNDLENYRFQKTIKDPSGSCQIQIRPQRAGDHYLDVLHNYDVVRIYEFGILKFIGYLIRIGYTGTIGNDGKPKREVTLTAKQFGGLLAVSSFGLGLGTALGLADDPIRQAATVLYKNILDASVDGVTYAEMVTVVVNSLQDYLTAIGASGFTTYLGEYLDTTTGLTSSSTPLLPRQADLFTGTEQSLNFWSITEQLVQKPFNEFWIDNGPRMVSIDGTPTELPEKCSLVFRETPFNGTVISGGSPGNAFDSLSEIYVDENHFTRFDLSKGDSEVYTFYSVKNAAFQLEDITRVMIGQAIVDTDRIGKYLMRPLVSELFYTRTTDAKGDATEKTKGQAENAAKDAAKTLKNWFENNEDYLSGVVTHMVPSDASKDPKIGDKLRVYGIEGFFYVEGVAHTWNYGGHLVSNLTVTRGYNRTRPIELKDRIFRRNLIR